MAVLSNGILCLQLLSQGFLRVVGKIGLNAKKKTSKVGCKCLARTVVHDGLCKWTSAFVFLERSGVQFLQESQEHVTFNCKLNLKAVECYIIKVFLQS